MASSPSKDSKESSPTDFKSPPKYKFVEGEKVLCFHGPLIYIAKCLQTRYDEKNKVSEYHIHYSGWNKSWDEWVPESRVLKYNDANLEKQKELCKAQENEPKVKKPKKKSLGPDSVGSPDSRSSTPVNDREKEKSSPSKQTSVGTSTSSVLSMSTLSDSTSDLPKSSKSSKSSTVSTDDSDDESLSGMDIKVEIPNELKEWLVEDWNQITRERKLLSLPASVSVEQILDDYSKSKMATIELTPYNVSILTEVVDGIRAYFNDMLGSQLMYVDERKQYIEILESYPETPMSEIYGAMHLLRLFVKLGGVLGATTIDDAYVDMILMHMNEFVEYLEVNADKLFSLEDYEDPNNYESSQ